MSWEPLEERRMLSTLRWTNPAGGDWDTASNWVNTANPNDHHVPTAADDAQINTSGITVTHSSNTSDAVHTLTSQATLQIAFGSLAIAAASTISNLNLSSGTLTGAGALTVTGVLNWTGGTMSGAGTTTVAQGGTLNLAGDLRLDARTLANVGTATWSLNPGVFTQFFMADSATIENQAGATFTITGDVPLFASGTAPETFNNAGTLIRTGRTATGAARFSGIALNNTGSVQVQSGTLDLAGGGDSTGSFQVAADATLTFDTGGTQTLEAASQVGGAGTVHFLGGTAHIKGTYDVSIAGRTLIDGGTADFSSATLTTLPELTLRGGTLTGTGNVIVTGALNWTGGTMSGAGTTTVAQGGTLNLAENPALDARTLINAGTATYSLIPGVFTRFSLDNAATIENLAGATFTIAGDVPFVESGTAPEAFNNAGTLIRTGGTATGEATFSGIALNNSGVVRVQSGTLDLAGGGDSTGSFQVAAGATLTFDTGGTQTLEAASQVGGAGTVHFLGGTAHIKGTYDLVTGGTTLIDGGTADFSSSTPVTTPELDLSNGGTLTGTGNVIVSGALNWTFGTMSGAGTTTVAAGGQLNLSGTQYLEDCRTLVNAGSATWSGDGPNDGFFVNAHGTNPSGAAIHNLPGATFRITNDRPLGSPFNFNVVPLVFNNGGTLVKAGGTGTTSFYDVVLNNTGTLSLDSGTLKIVGNLNVDGEGILIGQPGTTLVLSGFFNVNLASAASLAGTTRNAARFDLESTVRFDAPSNSNSPHLLEVMSQDLGSTSAGFFRNFAYDTLQIGDPNASYVKLVDNAPNTAGTDPEALYVNTLIVGEFSSLDLNGLHVYARSAQIVGNVLNGSVSVVPPGGAIPANASAPGDLTANGQVDDWTVYGRAGQLLGATVHTGAGGQPAPPEPALNFAQVTLVDPAGNVMATASNTQAGADAIIPATVLPADGTYHIRVQSGSIGNYILAILGGSANDAPVPLNQPVHSQLESSISVDRWEFSAPANQQVQLHLLAASSPGIQFGLTGPGGFVGFSGLTADSPPVTLPVTGEYTLTVHAAQQQAGAYAFELETPPIALTLGTPLTESLAGSGQTQLFQVAVPASSPLQVVLRDQGADQNEVYLKFGAPPTRADYDYGFSTPASANQAVIVPQAAPGTWYILVYNALVPAAGSYTLTATASSIFLGQVYPTKLGTTRDEILTLTGAGFDATTTVDLVAADGKAYPANSLDLASATRLTATFSTGTVPAGVYSVRTSKADGSSSELANAFTVVQGGVAQLQLNLVVPSGLSAHRIPSTIEVGYSNVGGAAMPAPLLLLTATSGSIQDAFLTLDASRVQAGTWSGAVPDGFTNSVQLLAGGATPGLLQPGESEQVPVYWAGWLGTEWNASRPIEFHLSAVQADDPTPIDWNAMKDSMRPSSIAADAWNALFPNLVAQLGSTWGQYVTRMDADASYLADLGETVTDLGQLFEFEILQANGLSPVSTLATTTDMSVPAPGLSLTVDRVFSNSTISRNQAGPFGLGWSWSDGWQRTLSVQNDGTVGVQGYGTVVIADADGSQRRFQPDLRGGYFDQPDDHATLTKLASGGYTLSETDGRVTAFRPEGTIDYVQDPNGNRITAGYTNGLLTSLTHSSGQSLQIAYNSAGRIQSITDPATDHTTIYTYDPSNQHLLTVTTFDQRTTTYTYDLSGNPVTENALLSVTDPPGTHEFFGYDARGRLGDAHRDGGAEDVTYTYGPTGAVSATDAASGTVTSSFDAAGVPAKVEDALHHVTHFSYDTAMNLIQVTDPAGNNYRFSYDNNGNMRQVTDPLGYSVSFGYAGPFDRLTSLTDQEGHTTLYGYDPSGNEDSLTYADGSVERLTYDALGDPQTLTNRRGNGIKYQYDTSGRMASETFADGTQMTYHYEGNDLKSTTDPSGTTTLTYDNLDQLRRIDYPGGFSLKYTYDTGGRRIQMVDQAGSTVNYTYDAVGRLSKLTDASNSLIDQYTYYDDGRLKREDKGNGTFTTYEYDLAGELLHLINHAPDGSINSRFDYTYDELGRVATETTLDGQWTYTYNAIGELTHAVFASDHPASTPNLDLGYSYDPAGNRTQTISNGVTTASVSNNLNQYTLIGNETLGYDPDGNLIATTAGSQTSTYTYNDVNQLVAASTPAGTFTARYDALGFRIATGLNGQTTGYVVDPAGLGNVVGVYDASGGPIAHYSYGAGLVSRIDGGGAPSYFDFDALGSTAGLSGPTGGYQDHYRYDPFGGLLASSETIANPFRFAGESGVAQDPTGLDFMRARSYAPDLGSFLSPDPIGLQGGDSDLYRYAGNTPTSFVDPLGQKGVPLNCLDDPLGIGINVCIAPSMSTKSEQSLKNELYDQSTGNTPRKQDSTPNPIPDLFTPKTATVTPSEGDALQQVDDALQQGGQGPGGGCGGSFGAPACFVPKLIPSSPPPQAPGGEGPGGQSAPANSFDPNDKIGPAGYGSQGFIAPGGALPYRIDFENEATATAPAQRVVVTDPLDPHFDWKTFALTGVGFGDTDLIIPAGSQHYQTAVDITENSQAIEVDIELGLNPQTGLITATFQTIDPRTQLPPDVLTGFLPPENGTGRGKGFFTYVVQPKAGLPTSTQIRNIATVVFDANDPITTDQVDPHDPTKGTDPAKQDLITIDAGPPTSSVAPLPATETSAAFPVSWSGQDDPGGSGIASYEIYVSDNGGPFTLWQSATTQTSATFDGVNGHTYAFYSVATDNVGHVEATPTLPQATTLVHVTVGDVSVLVASSAPESQYGQAVTFTASVHPLIPAPYALFALPIGTVQFQIDGAPFGAPVNLVDGQAVSPSITTLAAGGHTITALFANNPNYHPNSGSATQTVDKAHLTVTADAQSMIAGGAVPVLTYTITGFVNGDGPSALTSPVVLKTTATPISPPGVYAITVGGATSSNYAITFVDGTLTVLARLATMTTVQEVFNKKHQVNQIIVDFSGPVNAGRADTLATYRLTIASKHGSFTAKNARTIALASALYSDSTDSVTLTPRKPFGLTKPVQLRVQGLLPGGDAVAILSKPGVSIVARSRSAALPSPAVRAVDHLLSAGSRDGSLHPLVTAALGEGMSHSAAPGSGQDEPTASPGIARRSAPGPAGPSRNRYARGKVRRFLFLPQELREP
jgi:RHS repeat-associated protein